MANHVTSASWNVFKVLNFDKSPQAPYRRVTISYWTGSESGMQSFERLRKGNFRVMIWRHQLKMFTGCKPLSTEHTEAVHEYDPRNLWAGLSSPRSFRRNRHTAEWTGVCVVLAWIILLAASVGAIGQVDIAARLAGTVTDPTGAVVPGAKVVALNPETGIRLVTASNDAGYYELKSVPAGSYTVTCSLGGFKSTVITGVVLHAGDSITLLVKMQVGEASTTVTVSGTAAVVDTETANIQTTFAADLIPSIPVEGRDPRESMELLMPGAVSAGTALSYSVPVTSFNGVSGVSNNYSVDGSNVNDFFHGASIPTPQSENIAEFSVSTSLPDASVARGAGGQVETVLKNGTNQFHGQFWTYFQNSAWNANSWSNNLLDVPRQHFAQHWIGGNVGGPVWFPKLYNGRNRTFFFVSYEHTSNGKTSTTSGQTITEAERSGDFSNSPDGIPVINGVPTPSIASLFGSLGKFIDSDAGKKVLPVATSGTDTYTWNPSYNDTTKTFTARVDQDFNDKHRLFGSLWWYQDNPTFQNLYDSFGEASWATQYPNSGSTWGEPKKMQTWTLNDTYTLSPSMVNNFIVGVTRISISVANSWTSSGTLFGPSSTGLNSVGDVASPDIQEISTPRSMGMGIYNGYINPLQQNAVDISDNFTMTRGRNTIKAGVEFRHWNETFYQTWGSGGNFSFQDSNVTDGGTGNGIADMMLAGTGGTGLGIFSQNNTEIVNVDYPAREAYLQDTIKVNPRVTAMIGLRWEPQFGVVPVHNNFTTFHPGQQSTVFPLAPTGLVSIGDRGVPSNLYGTRWGDVGPRASFAWDIFGNGKAALKGGYGLYSDYEVTIGFNGYTNSEPFGFTYPFSSPQQVAQPYAPLGYVPFPFTAPVPGAASNSTLQFSTPVSALAMAQNYNSGQIHEFNVTLEAEPIKTYLLSLAYVGTRGTHLDPHNENTDINWPRFLPGASDNTESNILSRRPYYMNGAGFSTISTDTSGFNNMYSALQFRVDKRYSYGLTLMGNYTFNFKNAAQQGDGSGLHGNGCRDYSNCALDYFSPGTTHTVAVAFRYGLPIVRNESRLIKETLGGWFLGGTTNFNTGSYGSVTDNNCNGYNFESADCVATYTGGGPLVSSRGSGHYVLNGGSPVGVAWLNSANFVHSDQVKTTSGTVETISGAGIPDSSATMYLGNATVGTWKGPSYINFNLSLDKDFPITEGIKFNFHAEAFNAFNHTELEAPGYNNQVSPNTSGFGAISSAFPNRSLQLSGHFVF